MSQHIYHIALRKPDDEKRQFIVESDLIVTNEKITFESAKEIADKNNCDIYIQFLGILKPDKKQIEPISIEKYSKDDVKAQIEKWKNEEGFQDAINSKDI